MNLNELITEYWQVFYTLEDYERDIQDLSPEEFEEMKFLKRRKKLLEELIRKNGGEL